MCDVNPARESQKGYIGVTLTPLHDQFTSLLLSQIVKTCIRHADLRVKEQLLYYINDCHLKKNNALSNV